MGRPPSPLLSKDLIAGAAMEMVSATGGFTVPALARKLEVSPSSLYNHVSGRDEIVELLRELAMSEVRLPADDPSRAWTETVADIMRSYAGASDAWQAGVYAVSVAVTQADGSIQTSNALAVTLQRAGFDPADTLRAITLMDCFVLGSALDLAAPVEPWESAAQVGPELAAALATGGPKPARADDAFEFGLAILLRGLADFASR